MALTDRQFESVSSGGANAWMTESIGGVVAIVLTILGLAHVAPVFLVAIALIAAGAALVLRGAAMLREFAMIMQRPGETTVESGGGSVLSINLLCGAAAIILGVLALLNVDPVDLVAIGVICLGGGLILSAGGAARLAAAKVSHAYSDPGLQRLASEIVAGSAGVQALIGLTAVVLGILALAGFASVVLILIALLAIGAFILIDGASVSGAMLAVFRHA
jgi:hypothetical protein